MFAIEMVQFLQTRNIEVFKNLSAGLGWLTYLLLRKLSKDSSTIILQDLNRYMNLYIF